MLGELLLLTAIGLLSYAFYKYVTLNNDYFETRKIKYQKPTFLFGGMADLFLNRASAIEFANNLYNCFPYEQFFGTFDFRKPSWVIRDPEIIKQLAVKDFEHFEDHRAFFSDINSDLFGNSLLALKGETWRDMRATLSPAFTGSKMRQMFDLVSESADEMVKQILNMMKERNAIELEMKDTFSKYTNDVIASSAFGIKINSFENPKNEFMEVGAFLQAPGMMTNIRMMINQLLPRISKMLNIQFFPETYSKFFKSLVIDTMNERKNRNIERHDMINILMKVRDGDIKSLKNADEKILRTEDGFATVEESHIGKKTIARKWTDDQLVAQCFLFFLAGFDTASSLLTFTFYELCINPDIQQKLYDEIKSVNDKLDNKRIDYDTLQKMKYLDQVICETLRKWPPGTITDRLCKKEYMYNDGAVKLHIEKGQAIFISISGLHHDANYFPNPEKFDPERFNDDNKDKIVAGTYIPFGVGPRNCIGSRFALMEIKAIVYYLLLNFTIEPNKNSQIPLKLKKTPFGLQTEKGMYLDFKLRNK